MRVVLICDFGFGLVNRILSVYAHFHNKPEIILVRRRWGGIVSKENVSKVLEIPLSVEIEPFSTPLNKLLAVVRAVIYLIYAFFLLPVTALDQPVHLIHAHFLIPEGLVGVMMSRFKKAPLVLTASGSDINALADHVFPRVLMRYVLFPSSRLVIGVSQPIVKKLERLGCRNAVYLPNCVDIYGDSYGRDIDPGERAHGHNILFVGSLTKHKRPDVLVRAFGKIADRVPDATLTIVGPGPMRGYLEKQIDHLDLTRRAHLLGYVQEEELVKLYRKSNVFVLPSSGEGLSVALLEAMSFGMCVVVSESAHSGVIQDQVEGLIFRPDDPDDLANKIMWIFENSDKSRVLSLNARAKCEQEYSMAVVGPRLERIYSRIREESHSNLKA